MITKITLFTGAPPFFITRIFPLPRGCGCARGGIGAEQFDLRIIWSQKETEFQFTFDIHSLRYPSIFHNWIKPFSSLWTCYGALSTLQRDKLSASVEGGWAYVELLVYKTRIKSHQVTSSPLFLERSFQLLITPDMLMLAVTMAYTGIVLSTSSTQLGSKVLKHW